MRHALCILLPFGASVLFAACASVDDSVSREDPSDQSSDLTDDATSCSGLAAPTTSACCTSCESAGKPCQANGCYNGYWCTTSTCACVAPPSGCTSGTSSSSASSSSSSSSSSGGTGDGTPTRVACTSSFGSALSTSFGRMDGYLVSIVPPGSQHACNADTGHVHLQVEIKNAVYDVAVNTDTLYHEMDTALPDGAWSEGWHTGISLDYVSKLGLHASGFTSSTPSAMAQRIESELASANHISVFATGYGPGGAHLVHRNGSGHDGAIVINPLSAKPHLLLFSFSNQSF